MAQLTTSVGGFVGPFFVSNKAPSTAELSGPAVAGMCYYDTDGASDSFCCFDGSVWKCAVLSSAAPTTTSTSTTTTTTTSTSSTTSTTTT